MTPDYDISILGAGPVGQVLALLLARAARAPRRIALVTRQATPDAPGPARDPRSLALNFGSRALLQSLNAWPEGTAAIENIHVSQRGRLGRVIIDKRDFGVPQLGYVAPYTSLSDTLAAAVAKSGVTVLAGEPGRVLAQTTGGVSLAQGEARWESALAVSCDGSPNDGLRRDYDQHAVLTSVKASQPRAHWAFERFTAEGPLALLPHPAGKDIYSVVWCVAPARARELATLGAEDFSRALAAVFGTRLGHLACEAPRHIVPLGLNARPELVRGRTVAIGNAAQTLHPVAGQGLNLGLRDAFQLHQALAPWLDRPELPPAEALAAFARSRHADRWLTAGLTDLMPRIFATGIAAVEHAAGAALLALDICAPLRAPLARHLLYGQRA
jgi:2-octaprenyl-6-methoxyphenol hydroxylase